MGENQWSDCAGSFKTVPSLKLREYWKAMEQSDWLILVIGTLNYLSRVTNQILFQF